jgi:hypothetical protein
VRKAVKNCSLPVGNLTYPAFPAKFFPQFGVKLVAAAEAKASAREE